MIWEPFLLALVLGIIVSAGLYFAYLWPSVEPEEPPAAAPDAPTITPSTSTAPDAPTTAPAPSAAADDAASPAP